MGKIYAEDCEFALVPGFSPPLSALDATPNSGSASACFSYMQRRLRVWEDREMDYRKAGTNVIAVLAVLAIMASAIAAGEATMATLTRHFCSAAVTVFAIASTVGLATRLRA